MKNLIAKLAIATGAVVVGLPILTAIPAEAASFQFSYTFDSGRVLSGTVDGDLQGDVVSNLSNLKAKYDNNPFVFTTLDLTGNPNQYFTLDGVGDVLLAALEPNGNDFSIIYDRSIPSGAANVFISPDVFDADTPVNNRTNFVAKSVSVPEPGTLGALSMVGIGLVGSRIRKKSA